MIAGTFDVKSQSRVSDVILDSLNRLHDAKLSGALKKDEFSKLITHVGDLFANKIKQGKATGEEIESVEAHLTGFTGDNQKNYFGYPHSDLDRGTKSALESIDFARQELEQRSLSARPVMEQSDYESSFKRLG